MMVQLGGTELLPGAIASCLAALALIGLLPRIFFRRGRLNAAWWLTAAPFALAGATLLAALGNLLQPFAAGPAGAAVAIALAVCAVALIGFTLGSHTRPVALWHQSDDRPDALVTTGAYAHVRHPFYASFLLVLLGCVAAFPHAGTLLALAVAVIQLNRTAAREETRLVAAFGPAYVDYMRRTGRFVPRGHDRRSGVWS